MTQRSWFEVDRAGLRQLLARRGPGVRPVRDAGLPGRRVRPPQPGRPPGAAGHVIETITLGPKT
jgi:hypothetical protein